MKTYPDKAVEGKTAWPSRGQAPRKTMINGPTTWTSRTVTRRGGQGLDTAPSHRAQPRKTKKAWTQSPATEPTRRGQGLDTEPGHRALYHGGPSAGPLQGPCVSGYSGLLAPSRSFLPLKRHPLPQTQIVPLAMSTSPAGLAPNKGIPMAAQAVLHREILHAHATLNLVLHVLCAPLAIAHPSFHGSCHTPSSSATTSWIGSRSHSNTAGHPQPSTTLRSC